jgi:ankyrin repeat protein
VLSSVEVRRSELATRCTVMANDAEVHGLRLLNLCDEEENAPSAAAVQSLVDKGANVNTKDKINGCTVLMNAVFYGHLVAVKTLLVVEGIDIRAKNIRGLTALMYACLGGNIEIVKALLEAYKKTSNFDINDLNMFGMTALMYSCMRSSIGTTKLLLSVPQINTYLKYNEGKTALDLALFNGVEIRALFKGELLPLLLHR